MALSTCAQEAIWLRTLLNILKAIPSGPTLINEDKQGAIKIAKKNPLPTCEPNTLTYDIISYEKLFKINRLNYATVQVKK